MKKILLSSIITASFLYSQNISSIEYKNLNKISPKIINEILDLRKGDLLDDEKINTAIKKFYNYGYFDDIKVDMSNNGKLTIDFKEKPSISTIEIFGYKQREDDIDALKNIIGIKKGSMYTPKKAQKAKEILLRALEEEGYIYSVVEIEKELINEHSVALVFNVNKGDEIIIKKANYYGAKGLNESDFDNVTINNEEEAIPWLIGFDDGKVNSDQLQFDARRINELYFEKGYLDAKVKEPYLDIDFASNEANIDFFIEEGNKYKVSDIEVFVDPSILKVENIEEDFKLVIGNTFNIKKLRKDQNFIRTAVKDKGYAFAQVKFDIRKDEKNSKVKVLFNVLPGKKVYVNDVKISGNTRTLDRVIRRSIYLAPGDLYSLTDLNDGKKKLQRSRSFGSIKIDEVRVSEDKIDLHVKVEEAPTGNLTFGGGYGSYDKLMINGSIKDSNVFGSGISTGISADLSARRTKFSFTVKNPAINDSKYNGEFDIHNIESTISRTNYDLDKETRGFTIGAGKEFYRDLYIGLKYRYDRVEEKFTNVTDQENPEDQNYEVSSLIPYFNYDNTDNYYTPREGFRIGTSVEFAGVGGDSKYIKTNSYLKYFYSIEDLTELDWIFKFKTQVRLLVDRGQINQGDSLYLGGPRTLRGYKSYAFGPDKINETPYKKMWANSVEVSFPLAPSAKIRWGLFYDYGIISKDYGPFKDGDFNDIKRSGAGALIEWLSPVGPLQLIFSRALDDEPGDDTSSFEFSLGGSF